MKTTETYGFPYPECDPPLVKDASQIVQLQQQALAVDAEVQRIVNLADDNLVHPPSARLTTSVQPITTTDTLVAPVFDTSVFQVNWGATVAQGSHGGMYVNEAGWYLAGGHALVVSATAAVQPMVRLTVNSAPASSWSTPAGNYTASNNRFAALSAVPLLLSTGDILRLEIKHLAAGSPSWDYTPHLWAVRLVAAS